MSADELAAGYGKRVCVHGGWGARVLHSHFDRYSLISPAHFSISLSLALSFLPILPLAQAARHPTSSARGVPLTLTLASAPVTQADSFTSRGVQSDTTAVE